MNNVNGVVVPNLGLVEYKDSIISKQEERALEKSGCKRCVVMSGMRQQTARIYKKVMPRCFASIFLKTGKVFDAEAGVRRLRKHPASEYYRKQGCEYDLWQYGKSIGLYEDAKKWLDVPSGRFVYAYQEESSYFTFDGPDCTVMCIMEKDFKDALSVFLYAKRAGVDMQQMRCYVPSVSLYDDRCDDEYSTVLAVQEELMEAYIEADRLPLFSEVFAELYNREAVNGFPNEIPIGRSFLQLRLESQMSNKDFADYFGIPVRTIENWKSNPKSLADYIYDLMEYKLLHENII